MIGRHTEIQRKNPHGGTLVPDLTLTEQEKMLQNLVRDFAEREVMPRAAELDEKAEFSH